MPDRHEPRRGRSATIPITLRIRRTIYENLPVSSAHYAGKTGAGKAGFLRKVLEEALIEKYGVAPMRAKGAVGAAGPTGDKSEP